MSFKIVTDSSCEIPKNITDKLGIEVLPIIVILGEKQFLDNVDIKSEQIFEGMRNGLVYTTSQIPLNTYLETFRKYAKQGQPIINVPISSGISSSYETSKIALNMIKEEYPNADIYTLDSKCCSLELGIAVYYMAMAANNNKSLDEILKVLEFCKNNTRVLFTVGDLKYLSRGGRISSTSALLGNTFNIKPIITVDSDGKLQVIDKIRSRKKVFSYMLDMMQKELDYENISDLNVVLSNAQDIDGIMELKNMIKDKFSLDEKQFFILDTGASIGVHTGPESLYLFYLRKKVPVSMYS